MVYASGIVDLDLDALAPPDRSFKLGGVEYRLPGDLPARTVVEFLRFSEKMVDSGQGGQAEQLEMMVDAVAGLVVKHNPQHDIDSVAEHLTAANLPMILTLAIGGTAGEDVSDAVVQTLTAGAQPEAGQVDPEHPTALQVEPTPITAA